VIACEDAPGPIDVECLAVVTELVDDRLGSGGTEPYLVPFPILQILTELTGPPVSKIIDSGEELAVVVCGKRIDSGPLRRIADPHVRIHDYVRNHHELIAASDAALLQSGLTTTLECLMADVPMVVVPLAGHWEQANVARYVTEKFKIEKIAADHVSPETLSHAIFESLTSSDPPKSPFRGDGHVVAAKAIVDVLEP